MSDAPVTAFAPGRVNLIGDHTDTTGGLVLPMAIDLGTTVRYAPDPAATEVRLRSADEADPAVVPLEVHDPSALSPAWARYVAAVVAETRARQPIVGGSGTVTTTLPVGAGLSSSAALELAVALALGFTGTTIDLASACQRAEQRASGVPCGIMDQLTSAAGRAGHALLIDCTSLEIEPIPLPDDVEVVVVHSGVSRRLAASPYAERRAQLEAAEASIGPLRLAALGDLAELEGHPDPDLARRARHVVTENARVRDVATALRAGDVAAAGELLIASHWSLAEDFGVSIPALDELVQRLVAIPGVYGARLTGAGFGGCVVAITRPGALSEGWRVRAGDGAHRVKSPG